MSNPITIHYHRDFDGMVAAAVLACILRDRLDEDVRWKSVNYDQRNDWENFQSGERFAIVDFHFHPRAEYWFDHHPTTFLTPELRAQFKPSDRWAWDENSPSCPPMIIEHAEKHWGFKSTPRFDEMAYWSNVIDAAKFKDVDQAIFGDDAALRISRSLAAAPERDWTDELVAAMVDDSLDDVADREDVEKAYQRAARNRDKALTQFPPTVISTEHGVVHYDASSNKIRRERFAPFFHHGDARYAVGVIPTRAGYHVTAGENPWDKAKSVIHVGELMERFGGGGHRAVGGANASSLTNARETSALIADEIRDALLRS